MGKSYRDQLLGEGETVALVAYPHAIVFYRSAVKDFFILLVAFVLLVAWGWTRGTPLLPQSAEPFLAGAGLVLGVIGLLLGLYHYLVWKSTEYVITSRRVVQLRGILSKEVFDSSLDFINDLRLRQTIFGRILGYGEIEVLTASDESGDNRQSYRYVANPARFLRSLEAQREQRRQAGISRIPRVAGPEPS